MSQNIKQFALLLEIYQCSFPHVLTSSGYYQSLIFLVQQAKNRISLSFQMTSLWLPVRLSTSKGSKLGIKWQDFSFERSLQLNLENWIGWARWGRLIWNEEGWLGGCLSSAFTIVWTITSTPKYQSLTLDPCIRFQYHVSFSGLCISVSKCPE